MSIKQARKIAGPVLVQTAEDETAIIPKVEWNRAKDQCWGWCGKQMEADGKHKCDRSFAHVVGDDSKAYDRLCEAFSSNKVAGHARVIMLNPVHEDIPALVVLLQATCNTFTHFDVQQQWREIRDLYHTHMQEILGPLVGHASDGDSRQRKLQLIDATSKEGERYEINNENFAYSALKGTFGPENLADRDFIHNAKKLINSLRHASRKLRIGGNLCTMNHLEMLFRREDILQTQHGLQMTDVERADRMNWESAQRVLFPRVRSCLGKIKDGESKPRENVSGTMGNLFLLEVCGNLLLSGS